MRTTAVIALTIVLAGCSGAGAGTGTPVATARCGAPAVPQVQFGSHLLGDSQPPVPYSSTPPTSGWHASGAISIGVGPLTEPQQVSVLESGAVVVTHGSLSVSERAALRDLASGDNGGRVAVAPYDRLPAKVVMLAGWEVLQRCNSVDPEAVAIFVGTYADDEPTVPRLDATPRQSGPEGVT